ncbi:LysR family transcriptional regulator [Pseudohoeflea suaedae]|uniref:LysR family transcriptional regulator n=1 Tax=Pseudohoeflea suaedae TaxID=877384 RepID=A0A4R5PPJ4_9HYPH|nr:LysR family transcriptional regulator [Pseudohoeflea suaedae]TDH39024.1 LysR family transcriptional regulator [Pseudohoeflea suaedae]
MKPQLDPRLLATFVQAARLGSLSAAAVQVGRTQSAVTMQMRRLEQLVGQDLLHRAGSGVRLTGSGERFLAYAERILTLSEEAVSAFSGTTLSGSIVFGCPEDYLVSHFPPLLEGFGKAHPEVEIRVVAASTDQLRRLLQSKQVDLALVSTRDLTDADDIVSSEALVWVGSQRSLEAGRFAEPLPLALTASNTLDHRAACDAMERAGLRYRIAYASNSHAGLVAVTRSGLAVSVMTENSVPPDLHVLGAPLPVLPRLGIRVAYAETGRSPAARAFGDHIARLLPSGDGAAV